MAAEPYVSVTDILTNDVAIEWYEAVAFVQEVCSRVSDSQPSPDPESIRLYSSGAIDLLPAITGEPATHTLGFLLTSLLQDTAPPAELRLIASEMIAATAPGAHLGDFSRRLAYYERPGRSRVLQQLYERAAAAVATAQTRAALEPSPDPTLVAAGHKPPGDATGERPRRSPKAYALAGATLIAAAAGIVAWRFAPATRTFPSSTVVGKARSTAESLVEKSVASGRQLLARAGLITDSKTAADHPTRASSETKTRSTARKVERPGSSTPTDNTLPIAVPVPPSPAGEAPPPAGDVPAAAAASVVAPSDPAAAIGPDLTIYSSADSDVLPPTLVSRQLPKTIAVDAAGEPSGTAGEAVLTVDQNGNVASVKIVSMPQQFQPRMLVSAMKAWRYRPATKDGRAVRYAVRVRIPF